MTSGQRVSHFQAHNDMVPCMLKLPTDSTILTASHGGEIAIWTTDWKRVHVTLGPKDCLWHHAAISANGRTIVLTGQGHAPAIVTYAVEMEHEDKLKIMAHVLGEYTFVEWINDDMLAAVIKPPSAPPELHAFTSTLEQLQVINVCMALFV